MCTRFVYNGNNMITGFNFDIDLAVWDHKVFMDPDRFFIGIRMEDGKYHSFHGVNRNGNVGTLLYVHENPKGKFADEKDCYTITGVTESFIKNEITFDEVLWIAKNKRIVYAPDASMQAMLSDSSGRILVLEPGIGFLEEKERYSLITNYSLLEPESTKPYLVQNDDRYERMKEALELFDDRFSVSDAFSLLFSARQEGAWATRVSFVYSAQEHMVYYALNREFHNIRKVHLLP